MELLLGKNNHPEVQELSLNPEYWGPKFWDVLHLAAVGYSKSPTPAEKLGFRMFFDSLRYVLPCQKCRGSYENYLNTRGIQDSDLQSRDDLFRWVFELHNSVNLNLNKPMNQRSLEDLQRQYYPLAILPGPSQGAQVAQVVAPRPLPLGPRRPMLQHKTSAATNAFANNMAQAMNRIKTLRVQTQPIVAVPVPAAAVPIRAAATAPAAAVSFYRPPGRFVPQAHAAQPQNRRPMLPSWTPNPNSSGTPTANVLPLTQKHQRSVAMYSTGCGCRRR